MGFFKQKPEKKLVSAETARYIVKLGTSCNILRDWLIKGTEDREFFIECLVENCKKFWEASGIEKTVTREIVIKELGI